MPTDDMMSFLKPNPGPRYHVAYHFTGLDSEGYPANGTGTVPDFEPKRDGKPSVLTPAHLDLIMKDIAETLAEQGIRRRVGIDITSIWRWEE